MSLQYHLFNSPIRIIIEWTRQEKVAGFTLQGFSMSEVGQKTTGLDIRALLFGRHELSFYGSMLEIVDGKVLLNPAMAVSFLADPQPLEHASVHFDPVFDILKEAASCLQSALHQGWYIPEMPMKTDGRLVWKLTLPSPWQEVYEALQQKLKVSLGMDLAEWFNEVMAWLMAHDPQVRKAWTSLMQDYPILQQLSSGPEDTVHLADSAGWLDEQDWLIHIGIATDSMPFTTAIQLKEPDNEEDDWALQLVLQDKETDRFLTCNLHGEPIKDPLPEEWNQHILPVAERISGLITQICTPAKHSGEQIQVKAQLTDEAAWDFLTETSVKLANIGLKVLLPAWWDEVRRLKPVLKARIRSSAGAPQTTLFGLEQLVDFEWAVAMGDLHLTEEEFDRAVQSKQRLFRFRGQWVFLSQELVSALRKQMRQWGKKGLTLRDVLQLHLQSNSDIIESSEEAVGDSDTEGSDIKLEVEINEAIGQLIMKLQQTDHVALLDAPIGLQATLRPYQSRGFSWMVFLHQFGLGGCLADDMGLGKTVQYIAYLLHLKQTGKLSEPALLICPTSVLGNWQKELERFAPDLRVYVHYGPQRGKKELFNQKVESADLVLTSYVLSHLDEEELSSQVWGALGLDEAQYIKNNLTKQAKSIRRLQAQHRVALSGTPMENRLTELWSIVDFLNPRYLGSLSSFKKRYILPIERTNDPKLIAQVQKLIQPFLLRRSKKDPRIQLDLPVKQETNLYVKLSLEQAVLYENVLRMLFEKVDELSPMERRGAVLSTLTKLKQICNHSLLLEKDSVKPITEGSNKLQRLLEMVQDIRQANERCLIFTQFVGMGRILQQAIEQELGEKALFLHGSLGKSARDRMISLFQQSAEQEGDEAGAGILILSLKAGGTGLNLTAANHVIHFDRWWNPAVEDQATDRAYRIGQTKNVQVYKMITLGTLEERIDELLERKKEWSDQIVGTSSEQWISEMSTEDLHGLLALRKNWIE